MPLKAISAWNKHAQTSLIHNQQTHTPEKIKPEMGLSQPAPNKKSMCWPKQRSADKTMHIRIRVHLS